MGAVEIILLILLAIVLVLIAWAVIAGGVSRNQ